jgi:hypothetical protein
MWSSKRIQRLMASAHLADFVSKRATFSQTYSLGLMRAALATIGFSVLTFLVFAAEDVWHVPMLADVKEIRVWTPSHWYLDIKPDGAAHLYGGAAFADGAFTPSNTFTFSNVYASLSLVLEQGRGVSLTVQQGGTNKEFIIVTLETPGKKPSYTRAFTRDTNSIRALFDTAKQHCTPIQKIRFEKLWTQRPPICRP